jgi:hypothetical protein
MKLIGLTLPALALCAAPALAQGVGSKMPAVELEDYSQTPAKSYDDFLGRAVLIEFFAYW